METSHLRPRRSCRLSGGHRSGVRVEPGGPGPLICSQGLTRHTDYSQQWPGGAVLSDVMFR